MTNFIYKIASYPEPEEITKEKALELLSSSCLRVILYYNDKFSVLRGKLTPEMATMELACRERLLLLEHQNG